LFIIFILGSGSNFTVILKVPLQNKEKFFENIKNNKDLKIENVSNVDQNHALFAISNLSSFYNFKGFLLEMINNRDLLE